MAQIQLADELVKGCEVSNKTIYSDGTSKYGYSEKYNRTLVFEYYVLKYVSKYASPAGTSLLGLMFT